MEQIPHLDTSDFDVNKKELNSKYKNDKIIIMIYADWCGACTRDKPIYSSLRSPIVKIMALDGSDKENPLLDLFQGFDSYPSYYLAEHCKLKKLNDINDVKKELGNQSSCVIL